MQLFHTIKDLQHALANKRRNNKSTALVPTMGNLHKGHLSLVDIAKRHADVVVVSIFVNPTQFGVGEDFDSYPRTLEADLALLADKADMVFAPNIDEMYPDYPPTVQVLSGHISQILCGKTRPTHFDGVGLVVSKLFNIVRPNVAVFGKKDYQQLAIIRQMNDTLNFGIEIIGGEIVRADDGLALSSRNGYLSDTERKIAPHLNRLLNELANELASQHQNQHQHSHEAKAPLDTSELITQYRGKLTTAGFRVDYLEVLNAQLQPPTIADTHLVILTASYLGKTRLLDNVEIHLTA